MSFSTVEKLNFFNTLILMIFQL